MTVVYERFGVTVHAGDCLDVLAELPAASVHAVVTDPPYGLEFMGKEWDSFRPASARLRTRVDGRANPAEGKSVTTAPEAYVAERPYEDWCRRWAAESLRVLKPGGHLVAFGGPRTWHRLSVAVEDVGFEIRDSIAWLYASGFPKSLDVSKAIDRSRRRDYVLAAVQLGLEIPGNNLHDWTKAEHSPGDAWWERFKEHLSPGQWGAIEREVIGTAFRVRHESDVQVAVLSGGDYPVTAPATDAARRWQGWGTGLKPAFEPIIVARKPIARTVAANVLDHGTGALNIDRCRVGGPEDKRADGRGVLQPAPHDGLGRWPSNVVLSHADDECAESCAAGCPVAELDEQSGMSTSRVGQPRAAAAGDGWRLRSTGAEYDEHGGASRFFPVFRFESKAPSSERPRVNGVAHPTVKPLALMRWLVRLVTPPGGVVLDPFLGSGTTAQAARAEGFQCIGIERDKAYLPLIRARLDTAEPDLFEDGEVST
jgi:DNA modification methylase